MNYIKFALKVVVLPALAGFLLGRTYLHITAPNKPVTQEALSVLSEKKSFSALVKLTHQGRTFCSGTVISDTEVLTAAHCVVSFDPFIRNVVVAENFEVTSIKKADLEAVSPVRVYGYNLRQDTAILKGDFSLFKKAPFKPNPEDDILVNKYRLATCGFPNAGKQVCYGLAGEHKATDKIGFTTGQMYAGMSGGPVVNLDTGEVVAVNHAVADRRVIVAPIINLMDGLTLVEGN